MQRPTVEDTHKHTKIIYFSIIGTCLIILLFFSYTSYFVYNITKETMYSPVTTIIALPVLLAAILMVLLTYTGKKKFYTFVRDEELELYSKLR